MDSRRKAITAIHGHSQPSLAEGGAILSAAAAAAQPPASDLGGHSVNGAERSIDEVKSAGNSVDFANSLSDEQRLGLSGNQRPGSPDCSVSDRIAEISHCYIPGATGTTNESGLNVLYLEESLLLDEFNLPEILHMKNAVNIQNGEELRNINCYAYLRNINLAFQQNVGMVSPKEKVFFIAFERLNKFMGENNEFDINKSYGNAYTEFLLELEEGVDLLLKTLARFEEKVKLHNHEKELEQLSVITALKTVLSHSDNMADDVASLKTPISELENKYNRENNDYAKLVQAIKTYKGLLYKYAAPIDALYNNPCAALERTNAMILPTVTRQGRPELSKTADHSIVDSLKASDSYRATHVKHDTSPSYEGSRIGAGTTWIQAKLGSYKPMTKTSLPSKKPYAYTDPKQNSYLLSKKSGPKTRVELRMGTQGEFVDNARVNPLFLAWIIVKEHFRGTPKAYAHHQSARLELANKPMPQMSVSAVAVPVVSEGQEQAEIANAHRDKAHSDKVVVNKPRHHSELPENPVSKYEALKKFVSEPESRIRHVYFNNLGLDRTSQQGLLERKLTLALQASEKLVPGLAVITLPSDHGLMDKKLLGNKGQPLAYDKLHEQMVEIATGTSQAKYVDFYISPEIKNKLYKREADEVEPVSKCELATVKLLVDKSFKIFGFKEGDTLTPAQIHAVYFHFTKYEMTDYILRVLDPDTFNMTCKDAIDRGGISSAYYNLVKSIEQHHHYPNSPCLSQEEFTKAIHAAPAMVKGRGINNHGKALLNAVTLLVSRQHKVDREFKIEAPRWLKQWVTANTNHLPFYIQQLNDYSKLRSSARDYTFFSMSFGFDKKTKLDACQKLLDLLTHLNDGELNTSPKFTEVEWGALRQGRLGKIVTEMAKEGVINLRALEPKDVYVSRFSN